MGRTDGTVVGSTRILNNGSNAARFNVVLVAEGYTAAEQTKFNNDCDAFIQAMRDDRWFNALVRAINVHRINVESTESGADDPDDCDGGADTEADTFFDSSHCTGDIQRLMHADLGLVREICDDEVPEWDQAILLVNSAIWGGAGGSSVAIMSTGTGDWPNSALHELGHSAFNLADEYEYWADCGEDGHDAPFPLLLAFELSEPNVTYARHGLLVELASQASHVKWGHLIESGIAVPTRENSNCGDCPSYTNPLQFDTQIGLFEGAQYHHCDIYRPAFSCRMRNSGQPFCFVCVEAAHMKLRDFLPAGARVIADADAIDFGTMCSGASASRSFRIANLGTVFGEITVRGTAGGISASRSNFGVPPDILLVNPDGLIPGQMARIDVTFGPINLPSTVPDRVINAEVEVLVDGVVATRVAVSARVVTPHPTAEISPNVLDFGDVVEGFTMYRRIRIRNRVDGCGQSLEVIVTAPPADFRFVDTIASDVDFILPAGAEEHVYLKFTANGAAGATFAQDVRVRTSDPNVPEVVIPATARIVAPTRTATTLVIDRSGSMEDPTGDPSQRKIDHAIFACDLFLSLLGANDEVGLVRFNHQSVAGSDDLVVVQATGGAEPIGAGRIAVRDILLAGTADPLRPQGGTSIGAGMVLGSATLDGATVDRRAMLVLTDGRENTGTSIDEAKAVVASKSPAQRVFAVGLGLDQITEAVGRAASVSGGAAFVTGDVVEDKEFLLQKLFVQILSDQADWSMIDDPVMRIEPRESRSVPISIAETDILADFVTVFRPSPMFPKYMRVWIEAPDGTTVSDDNIASYPTVKRLRRPAHTAYRVAMPPFVGDPLGHLGSWRLWIENQGSELLHCAAMARAYSNLRCGGGLVQDGADVGAVMKLNIETSAFGLPIDATGPIRVSVRKPDGTLTTQMLGATGPGMQRGVFTDTDQTGPYVFECRATILTPSGTPVTRYRLMTGFILPKDGKPDVPTKPGKPEKHPCGCKDKHRLPTKFSEFDRLKRLLDLLQ